MNKEIKKKLASNWFKLLQNIICNDIEKIEKKKNLNQNYGKEIKLKMKVVVNLEF